MDIKEFARDATAPVMEFEKFPKIPRLYRDIIITEKIDGTNAQIAIDEHDNIMVGSRTRWLTENADNYDFWKWCREHRDELLELGPGRHYGEWWGQGIQRNYGLTTKRFSLFNVGRWNALNTPGCVDIVPILYEGEFTQEAIDNAMVDLKEHGSHAAINFKNPEGIVVYHKASNQVFKVTFKMDKSKWELKE